jgi:hypothetical protein
MVVYSIHTSKAVSWSAKKVVEETEVGAWEREPGGAEVEEKGEGLVVEAVTVE